MAGRQLVPDEDREDEYGEPAPEAADEIAEVAGAAPAIGRRRLLAGAGGAAGTAIGLALLAPAASLGPAFDLAAMARTPWRRGRRLVDEEGNPIPAASIHPDEFTTAYPEGADPEQMGSPIILIRLDPSTLRLPASRRGWAPEGILAYSKICTHAGCAIALYRAPLFEPAEQPPGLVCPCHYSTFDPATGGTVVFGPAGRPLPQLPIRIDRNGNLRAGGTFSGPCRPVVVGGAAGEADVIGATVRAARRADARCAARASRGSVTSSPTTGRSCWARSRSTRSSCSSPRGRIWRSSSTRRQRTSSITGAMHRSTDST